MRTLALSLSLVTLGLATAGPLAAQSAGAESNPRRTVTIRGGPGNTFSFSRSDDRDRAFLGIATGSGGKRDTLGLLIESVTPNSPAEKAGLEEGQRLQSINGVSLKLDREDAGEPELSGMMQRRLTRELAKVKPGDEVSLTVWTTGGVKTLRVKTGSPDDLMSENERSLKERITNRAVLGVALNPTGSKRDTLGIFISSVTDGGPADKAGLAEGDRIASIDGTDLRVPHDDAGEMSIASARRNRLTKALREKKPGDEVSLRVFQNGRYKDLKVKLGKASELGDRMGGFLFNGDEFPGLNLRNFNFDGMTMPRISIPRISIPRILRGGDLDDEESLPMRFRTPEAVLAPEAPDAPSAQRMMRLSPRTLVAPLAPARARFTRGTVSI